MGSSALQRLPPLSSHGLARVARHGMVAAVLVTACGGETPRQERPGADAAPAAGDGPPAAGHDPAWQECSNESGGFIASYPTGWETNDGAVMPACSLFDPEPFTVPYATEVPEDIAVVIHVDDVNFHDVVDSGFGIRIESREETRVAGHLAVRQLIEHTGDGLHDRGLQSWQYIVDWAPGRTLFAVSHSAGEPAFAEKRRVLDAMMERLRHR
jgi:hypothetical protein